MPTGGRRTRPGGRAAGARALVVAAAAALGGCGLADRPAGDLTIAEIDSERLTWPEFEAYLAVNLPDEPTQEDPPDERAAVLSRLLDNFVLEALLLREARRAGFDAGDREVEAYLRMGADEHSREPRLEAAALEAVRRVLIVQKFRESWLRKTVRITPQMIEASVAEQRRELVPRESVVLRALLLASPEQAQQVYEEIRRRRMTFNEAVVAYANAPGQGLPVEMGRDGLPPELDAAIAGLRTGRVTPPVELHGSTYLFELVARHRGTVVAEEELRVRAEEELLERLRREALARLERDLRAGARVRILRDSLPFSYVPEAPG